MERIFRERLKTGVNSVATLSNIPGFRTEFALNSTRKVINGVVASYINSIDRFKADIFGNPIPLNELGKFILHNIITKEYINLVIIGDDNNIYKIQNMNIFKTLFIDFKANDKVTMEYIDNGSEKIITSIIHTYFNDIPQINESDKDFVNEVVDYVKSEYPNGLIITVDDYEGQVVPDKPTRP